MSVATVLPLLPLHTSTLTCASTERTIRVTNHSIVAPKVVISDEGEAHVRRPRADEENEAASDFQLILATLDDPSFWDVVAQFPGNIRTEGMPGRPPAHPTWVYIFFMGAVSKLRSQRRASIFFRDSLVWERVQELSKNAIEIDRRSNNLDAARFDYAGERAPRRHHMSYFLKRLGTDEWSASLEAAKHVFSKGAVKAAEEKGLLDPSRPLRYNNPDPSQYIAYDGTVFRPPSKSQPRGDAKTRIDDASGFHGRATEEGEPEPERVYGSKVVFASVRSDDFHGRHILDFEMVPGKSESRGVGDEGKHTLISLDRLRHLAPGARGIIIDSVLRGRAIEKVAGWGLVTINYPYALANPEARKKGRNNSDRTPKETKVKEYVHSYADGARMRTCSHEIYVVDSVFCTPTYDDGGKLTLTDLVVDRYEKRRNRSKRAGDDAVWRFRLILTVPCQYGDHEVPVALYHNGDTPQDVNGFVRGEYMRFYPTNTAAFQVLYGRRNDTESLHNQIKRTMPRMPVYGTTKQAFFMLGLALTHNAATRAYSLRRAGLPSPFDDGA